MDKTAGGRLENLFKIKLGELLIRESHDPSFNSVSITRLKIDSGMEAAKIHFTCFGFDPSSVETALNKQSRYYRSRLFKVLRIKNVPVLKFIYDKGIIHSEKIDSILHKIQIESDQNESEIIPDKD